MKKTYIIILFNILIVAALAAILGQKTHTFYPWHNVVMFVFNAYIVTATIISSYLCGKSLFKTDSSQILSLGFFLTSIGFIILATFVVGLNIIISQFNTFSFINNFAVFVIAFIVIPILTARPNKIFSKP